MPAIWSGGLGADGLPPAPVRCLRLDDWVDADPDTVARAAGEAAASLALTIGIAGTVPAPRLHPLLDALTLTLVPCTTAGPTPEQVVPVPDPDQAYADIATAVAGRPQTALALDQLLRQTAVLPVGPGLAAEAAVYSMLLGGSEFASWLPGRPPAAVPPATPVVALHRDGDTLQITLEDPARRNALSVRLREELITALELAVLDTDISAVSLTGAGPVFCSGGDLAEFGTATDLVAAYLVRLDRAPWRLVDQLRERLGDQMHVHVHGAAVGAGLELAAFAGRLTCTPDATFWLPELGMGLVPGAGGTVSVGRRIGRWRTAWLVLSGTRLDAATALVWGLVDQIETRG